MRKPFDGDYILTQGFGQNPEDYKQFGLAGHNGLDYGLPMRTRVLSPHHGKVIEATLDPQGYGLYIKIENDKEGSVLAHFAELRVGVGDLIEEGQLIAYSDTSGNSTGPHLHWGYYLLPRDRTNGYAGFIDQISLINKMSGTFVDEKTFINLVAKSSGYDQVVQYLDLGDPNATPADKVTASIAGIKSSVSACQNNLTDTETNLKIAKQEIVNKIEQLAREREDCQEQGKIQNARIDSLSKQLKIAQEPQGELMSRIKALEGQVDNLAKEKGELLKKLAIIDKAENILVTFIKYVIRKMGGE